MKYTESAMFTVITKLESGEYWTGYNSNREKSWSKDVEKAMRFDNTYEAYVYLHKGILDAGIIVEVITLFETQDV